MEFLLAGIAASSAGFLTNPLEVVKIRFQLQGELKARGQYYVPYKHVFEAMKLIAQKEGIRALQKGVVPFCCYQFTLNGIRLGTYQLANDAGIMKNSKGERSIPKFLLVSISCGIIGGMCSSPFYLIKTHLQSKSCDAVLAVGAQHEIKGTFSGISQIVKSQGILGLWRGASTQIPRLGVASCAQLYGFEKTKEYLKAKKVFADDNSWFYPLSASLIGGVSVALAINPFDLIATRFYNQKIDSNGKGLYYTNFFDCAIKICKAEGPLAYFKGVSAAYFRLGPFTMFNLLFWDRLNYYNKQRKLLA